MAKSNLNCVVSHRVKERLEEIKETDGKSISRSVDDILSTILFGEGTEEPEIKTKEDSPKKRSKK